jgi:hypothetical protein
MLTLREPGFPPKFCLTASKVVAIPSFCAIGLKELPLLGSCDLRFANLLLRSHNKTTRNAAAARPPTVPPTIVPVDGFVLGLTGSAIVCPVGWLLPDTMLPLRLLGDVLVAVGIAPTPFVEPDMRDVTCAMALDCVPLGIELLTASVGAESGVEIGAAMIKEAGKDADAEEGAATDAGTTGEGELAAGVGVEAGELDATFPPAAETATFVGWLTS